MTGSPSITAVIVTFNRKALLLRCLSAMLAQTRPPERILVVDNSSSDGTAQTLADEGWLDRTGVSLMSLAENTGGAGGFAAGIDRALAEGADWVWVMDDDAEPHHDALEKLLDAHPRAPDLYGSVAVSGSRLSWVMTCASLGGKRSVETVEQLQASLEVQFIPFLGLLISRELVSLIGLPDAGFFLAADDVDFCMRARSAGARVVLVGLSRVEHPPSERYFIQLPWRRLSGLRLAPWKHYYDVRNRLFVARNHYGLGMYYKTIPGSCVRLLATLIHEPNRLMQCKAFMAGMIDGLLGRKGRRHERWGL